MPIGTPFGSSQRIPGKITPTGGRPGAYPGGAGMGMNGMNYGYDYDLPYTGR